MKTQVRDIMDRALDSWDKGGAERTSIKGETHFQSFTYQFIIMKISTKITNIHITTPMVSTKTSTASVSGRLDLFICNSRGKKMYIMIIPTERKRKWRLYI